MDITENKKTLLMSSNELHSIKNYLSDNVDFTENVCDKIDKFLWKTHCILRVKVPDTGNYISIRKHRLNDFQKEVQDVFDADDIHLFLKDTTIDAQTRVKIMNYLLSMK
jgi:hypothetical protein